MVWTSLLIVTTIVSSLIVIEWATKSIDGWPVDKIIAAWAKMFYCVAVFAGWLWIGYLVGKGVIE